ncbi:hypothetical protein NCCNTM_05780 [Mycolicibacterium sp. NCC-Tsukiji]|jgi:hypothetical protein|nr:hypothetical protein NCCNTM_05780 [Mycolicibacterium sp. NCC-Tsukiji]
MIRNDVPGRFAFRWYAAPIPEIPAPMINTSTSRVSDRFVEVDTVTPDRLEVLCDGTNAMDAATHSTGAAAQSSTGDMCRGILR